MNTIPTTSNVRDGRGCTIITTYDKTVADDYIIKFEKSARSFQKSGNDGLPDCYTITINPTGKVVDITRDFTPMIG